MSESQNDATTAEALSGGNADVNQGSEVSAIHNQISKLQNQLTMIMQLGLNSSDEIRDGGFAEVEFVKTIPSRSILHCYKKGESKTILHPFHVDFPEGCVSIIMGPSGAGKTTLLDFLLGTLGRSVLARGEVSLPDNDAYVPQDDRLHTFYTCQDYMEHYARLSGEKSLCSRSFSFFNNKASSESSAGQGTSTDEEVANDDGTNIEFDIDKHISAVLAGVGLTKEKDTIVGGVFQRGLSGGQKRRLSVSLEALSNPLNLFLDEPTSGLDSESALGTMEYLRDYARSPCPKTGLKRRVILTIHQPSSFIWELVDNVILLAEGRLMYQGRRAKMEAFFAAAGHPTPMNYNPADHYVRAIFTDPATLDANQEDEIQIQNPCSSSVHELWSDRFKKWSEKRLMSLATTKPAAAAAAAADTTEFKEAAVVTADRESFWPSRLSYVGNASRTSIVIRRDPSVGIAKAAYVDTVRRRSCMSMTIFAELTCRYFTNLAKNPGILGLRIIIYAGFSLVLGVLFFRIEDKQDMFAVAQSRSGLLYFIVAFFTSMAVASVPFAIVERNIMNKEVRNHRYHPVFFHAAQALASIPSCFILAVISTVILMPMTKMHGMYFFGFNIFLLLLCADALAQLVSHIAPEFISALAISSGLFGIMSLLMGFLIKPSHFPGFIKWTYYVPCTTYSFRALMVNEFSGQEFDVSPISECTFYENATSELTGEEMDKFEDTIMNKCPTMNFSDGDAILQRYEMADISRTDDMIVLICWALAVHVITCIYLHLKWWRNKRIFVYTDRQ